VAILLNLVKHQGNTDVFWDFVPSPRLWLFVSFSGTIVVI